MAGILKAICCCVAEGCPPFDYHVQFVNCNVGGNLTVDLFGTLFPVGMVYMPSPPTAGTATFNGNPQPLANFLGRLLCTAINQWAYQLDFLGIIIQQVGFAGPCQIGGGSCPIPDTYAICTGSVTLTVA